VSGVVTSAASMARLAEERHAEGLELRRLHREGAFAGVCGTCNRSMPCDERKRGSDLVDHYGNWKPPVAAHAVCDQAAGLVRRLGRRR